VGENNNEENGNILLLLRGSHFLKTQV